MMKLTKNLVMKDTKILRTKWDGSSICIRYDIDFRRLDTLGRFTVVFIPQLISSGDIAISMASVRP